MAGPREQVFQVKRRGAPSVAVDRDDPSKVVLTIELDPRSSFPNEWKGVFDEIATVGLPESMSPPRLQGHGGTRPRVIVECDDTMMEKVVTYVDERIAAANMHYRTDVYPAKLAKRAEASKTAEERDQRLKDLQARMDRMGPPSA
jgi:hypothetical protein